MSAKRKAQSPWENRQLLNVVNIILTCSLLFLSVKLSDGTFHTRITQLTANLDKVMNKIMDDGKVNYTNYQSVVRYKSNVTFHPKGMDGLYNLTTIFMDLVLDRNLDVSSVIKGSRGNIEFDQDGIGPLILHLAGITAIAVILLLFVVFLPFCGFCFCCCRCCCGNCGAHPKPCGKRRDVCEKFIYGTLLICLTTLFLFCVVCTFVSSQRVNDGIQDAPQTFDVAINDVKLYLNETRNELSHLLTENYNEFANGLFQLFNNGKETVMDELKELSNATALTNLTILVNTTLPAAQGWFILLKNNTNQLRVYASELNEATRRLRTQLLETLNKCEVQECKELMQQINNMRTTIDFNKLPDVTNDLKEFNEIITNLDEVKKAVQDGNNRLNQVEEQIGNAMSKSIYMANNTIKRAEHQVRQSLANVSKIIDKALYQLNYNQPIIMKHLQTGIDYTIYFYWAGLAIGSVFLIISICLFFGLVCGICGKRPDGYNDNCCNKGTGSQFLICAVMLIFLCGGAIAAIALITFLSGIFTDRVVCQSIRQPHNSKVLQLIDAQLGGLDDINLHTTIQEMLVRCYRNESIYKVAALKSVFDLDDIKRKFDIRQALDDLEIPSDILDKNFVILDARNRAKLENLAKFNIEVDFDKFKDELKENFTNVNFDNLINDMTTLIKTLPSRFDNVKTQLSLSLMHLNVYKEKILVPMKETAINVTETADLLNDNLKMGRSDFSEAIHYLMDEIDNAASTLKINGTALLTKVAEDFKMNVQYQVHNYTERVYVNIGENVGKCTPLMGVVNATTKATCDKILLPLNGFWFTLLASLVLFIPMLLVSIKLANLYQKYKSYGPYVEAEYLYDAYGDRDSIPLNSANGGKGRKKKNKKYKRYENTHSNVNPPSHHGISSSETLPIGASASSHLPDTRYADMAPKQWQELPPDGPPQYQRSAPTEYERPPPYYFPGNVPVAPPAATG